MWELLGEHLGICIPEIETQSFENFGDYVGEVVGWLICEN
jgi:hypothetical protein